MQIVVAKNPEKINHLVAELKNKKYFVILLSILLLGMLCGALAVKMLGDSYGNYINKYFENFFNLRASSGFTNLFFNLFLTSIASLILIGVSSFGISGLLSLPSFIFLKGIGSCIISGLLYRNFSLEGIAFADLILLPFSIASNFIFLYLSSYGIELSLRFLNAIKCVSVTGIELRPKCILFLKKMLWCVLFVGVVSLLESIFTVCFINYFSFL